MAMNVSEYWIISAPGDKTCQQTWDRMNAATMKQQLSSNWKFHIPDLKVGTLDQLVGLSDDLGKWMVIYFMHNVVNRERECHPKSTYALEMKLIASRMKFGIISLSVQILILSSCHLQQRSTTTWNR